MQSPPPLPAHPPPSSPAPRRGRTPLLLACAALLGVVAGVAGGYTVQADREPAATPPLSQPGLAYPAEPLPKDEEPEPLTAEEDPRVRTEGDLRRLLLRKPGGAEYDRANGFHQSWVPLADYVMNYTDPRGAFHAMLGYSFRRAVVTHWEEENAYVTISLVQFRDDTAVGSIDHLETQQGYLSDTDQAGNRGTALPGSGNGRVWVYEEPYEAEGSVPVYEARCLARRGDIVMELFYSSPDPIEEDAVLELAERQVERL
ncbi:hypothetical protein [Streptomyces chumphonensis]|uniref:hypothetical protein n=1 Tax=Streptomyces chumphonensis TaxID=1214925 RepID=UPI003D756669